MKKYLIFFSLFLFVFSFSQNKNQEILNKYERLIHELSTSKQEKGKPFDFSVAIPELKKRNININDQKEILKMAEQWHKIKSANVSTSKNTHNHQTQRLSQPVPLPNNPACPNAGFENGNFNNWIGSTANVVGLSWATAPAWANGFISNGSNAAVADPLARHTLTTIPAGNNNPALGPIIGYDSLSINPATGLATIPVVSPFGSGISVRLGNANTGGETERFVFPMSVSLSNAQYTFQYAIVLNDPVSGHTSTEQPQFTVNILDQNGTPIGGCASYSINTQQAQTDPTFIFNPSVSYVGPGGFQTTAPVYFKNWTTIGVNLSAYIGQNIQIEFRSYDCALSGHFGYAYVDAWCGNPAIPINFCGSTTATLVGPAGFVGYQWYGPNGMVMIPGATNDSLLVSNAVIGDTYTLIATAQNGCNVTIVATIVPSTVGIQSVNTTPSCVSGNSGSATVVASGSSLGNYSYSWVSSTNPSTVISTSSTATGLSPGQYYITVSDPACGTVTDTITVGISPPLFYTDAQTYCSSPTQVIAPTGSNYIWYNSSGTPISGANTASLTVNNPVNNSNYTVVFNNSSGCRDSLRITLNQTTTPNTVFASNITPTCFGLNAGTATINMTSGVPPTYTLTVTGPQNYSNSSAGATQNLQSLAAGTYTVSFIDGGQCSATATFIIDTVFVNVTSSIAPDTICGGQSAVVTFNYGGGAPTQCGPATSPCGSTSLQTVGNGTLQNTSTTWPSPYGNWYANEKYQILYTAADLLASGISPGKITSIAFNVASIPSGMNTTFLNYNIKIGCTSVGDLDPTGSGFSVPFQSGVNQLVFGPQNYVVTTGWNTHNFSVPWEWDGVSNIIVEICYDWVATSNYTTNAIMNQTSTTYRSFIVYYSDVTVACPQTTASASYSQRPNTRFTTCQSAASPSDFTYNWSPNTGVSGTAPTVNLSPSTSTDYTLTVTSNFGGCQKVDTIPIVVVNPFTLTMPSSQTYCISDPADQITAVMNPSGNSGSWSGPGMTDSGNNADGVFNPSLSDTGNVYVYFTAGGGGCTIIDSVLMVVNTTLDPTINSAGPFCITDNPINLTTISPGGSFVGPGITDSINGVFSPSAAGSGTITVQYQLGAGGNCPATGQTNIIVNPQPTISISSSQSQGCAPILVTFNANVPPSVNGTSQWTFGDGSFSVLQTDTHTYADTGFYDVTYIFIDDNGCSDTIVNNDMIYIQNDNGLPLQISPINDLFLCEGDPLSIVTDISGGNLPYSLSWSEPIPVADSVVILSDSLSQVINPQSGGLFTLTVTDVCLKTVSESILVEVEPCDVIYPNVITPNGDGVNDALYFENLDKFPGSTLLVYNRWGTLVFESSNYNNQWVPTVVNGVYYYILELSNGKTTSSYFHVFKDK